MKSLDSINKNYNTSTAYKTIKVNVIDVYEEDESGVGLGLGTATATTSTGTGTQ